MDMMPVWISIKTALAATLITFFLGLAAARYMAGRDFRGKSLVDGFFILPLVLPPTVVGFGLLCLFGRNGPVGQLLFAMGRPVVFSWSATVIASAVVSFPLMYQAARAAFEQVEPNLENAARTLGASEWRVFWRISVPLAWPGIAAGAVLAFARSLGEFGATLMLAGNIPGKTQTINYYLLNEALYLVDLPGYGYAKVSKTQRRQWQKMIERYIKERQQLKGVILLLDIRHEPGESDILMKDWLNQLGIPLLAIATKADKISRGARSKHTSIIRKKLELPDDPLCFSAETGEGVGDVLTALEEILAL